MAGGGCSATTVPVSGWAGRPSGSRSDGLQRGLPQTPLQRAVLAASGAAGYSELLQACYSATPTWLASFSPLVSQYAERDPLADRIAQRAAAKLERLLFSLVPGAREPIVLAGSVLTRPGPVSTAFRARLAARATNPVLTSTNGVIGAVWIGLQSRVSDAPKVHDRLVATIEQWL